MPVQQWLDDDDYLHEETLRQQILDILEQVYQKRTAAG